MTKKHERIDLLTSYTLALRSIDEFLAAFRRSNYSDLNDDELRALAKFAKIVRPAVQHHNESSYFYLAPGYLQIEGEFDDKPWKKDYDHKKAIVDEINKP
jgi:hypothetical protein